MKSRDFCYWLQGYFELNAQDNRQNQSSPYLTSKQVEAIRNHLSLVFAHEIDPSMGDKPEQDKLNAIHNPAAEGSGYNPNLIMRC